MPTLTFRSPVTRALHPKEWDRPEGNTDFRVTQQFDDPDFYWSGIDPVKAALGHRATDIGQGFCGGLIVAMQAGRFTRLRDNATALGAPTNALGGRIDHGFGITTEYWHLDGWIAADGALVIPGQPIGFLGKTGLGMVCHCHIEAKRNGVRFDPEPLMFGGSVEAGEDEDMLVKGKVIGTVVNREARLTTDTQFRSGVLAGDDTPIAVLPKGALVRPFLAVEGRPVGTAPDRTTWYATAKTGDIEDAAIGYVHSSTLTRTADGKGVAFTAVEATAPPRDCDAEVDAAVDSAINEERARWGLWLNSAPK